MATLYTEAGRNTRATWFLITLFLIVVIGLGWFLSYYFNNPGILVIAVLFSVLMNVASYWWSDTIVLGIAGAKPVRREEFFDLYTVTENLAIAAGLPLPRLYVIPDPSPNAFATGRNKEHAAIAVTTGLLDLLNRTELEGVIAHELSHIGNRDILLSTVVVVLVGFVTLLADFFMRSLWFSGRSDDDRSNGAIILIGVILSLLAPLFATLMQLAISRRREYLADASGALLSRYPEGLARALEKIGAAVVPLRRANRATAHLYITNPFSADRKIGKKVATLFLTHPPLADRVARLRR